MLNESLTVEQLKEGSLRPGGAFDSTELEVVSGPPDSALVHQ